MAGVGTTKAKNQLTGGNEQYQTQTFLGGLLTSAQGHGESTLNSQTGGGVGNLSGYTNQLTNLAGGGGNPAPKPSTAAMNEGIVLMAVNMMTNNFVMGMHRHPTKEDMDKMHVLAATAFMEVKPTGTPAQQVAQIINYVGQLTNGYKDWGLKDAATAKASGGVEKSKPSTIANVAGATASKLAGLNIKPAKLMPDGSTVKDGLENVIDKTLKDLQENALDEWMASPSGKTLTWDIVKTGFKRYWALVVLTIGVIIVIIRVATSRKRGGFWKKLAG